MTAKETDALRQGQIRLRRLKMRAAQDPDLAWLMQEWARLQLAKSEVVPVVPKL